MKRWIIIGLLLFECVYIAKADEKLELKTRRNVFGVNAGIYQYGTGIGLFYDYVLKKGWVLEPFLSFIMVRDEIDIPYYDYYYMTYVQRGDAKRLNFLPVMVGIKKYLFINKLEGNFKPHACFAGGAVVYFDPPNIYDFVERIKKMRTGISQGIESYIGVEFLSMFGGVISIDLGYQAYFFNKKLEGSRVYSGMFVKLQFGR